MSIQAQIYARQISKDKEIPPSIRWTFITLADYANHNGRAWPSIETLADDTGKSPRQIKRDLKDLTEKYKVIDVTGKDAGRGKTAVYIFPLKGDTDDQKGDTHDTKRVTLMAKRVTPMTQKGDTDDTLSYIEPLNNHNNNLDDIETQIADLLEFWIELTKYNTKNIGNDLELWQLSAINILNKTGWDLEKAKEALKATRTEKNTDKITYLKLTSIEPHVIARLDRQTNTPAPFTEFWDDLTQAEGAIARIQHTETRKALRDMGIWEQIEGKRNGALMNHRSSIEKLYREKVSS